MRLPRIGKTYKRQKNFVFVEIRKSELLSALKKLAEAGITRIADIAGYDNGKEIELIYRLPFDRERKLLNLKVRISRKNPSIKSATGIFPSAYIYERESFELIGVKFEGHPHLERMLLARTSPAKPLMKKQQTMKEVKN